MSDKQFKENVLKLLRELQIPIQLPQLLLKLGKDYKDRTVRRWLKEWEETGLVIKSGQKRGTHYIATSNASESATIKSCFNPMSEKIIKQIRRPYGLRKPVTYDPQWLGQYRPNIDSYLSTSQAARLFKIGE